MKQLTNSVQTPAQHSGVQTLSWLAVGALAVAFLLLALASIALARQEGNVALLWLPNALALAALLRQPQRHWAAYVAAVFAANIAANQLMGDTLGLAVALSGANALEILAAALLLRGLRGAPVTLGNVTTFLKLLLIAALLAPAVAACLGSAAVHLVHGTPYGAVWRAWWISDAMGVLMLLPVALSCSAERLRATLNGARLANFTLLLVLSLPFNYLAFSFLRYPFIVIALPLLVAALRLSFCATALLAALTVTFVVGLGVLGALENMPGGAVFLQESLHLSTALAVVLPLCLSLLMEQLSTDEQTIRESEARWKFALEGAGHGVWDRDMVTGKVFYSRVWKSMLGYAEHEIRDEQSEWSSRLHPEDRERVMQAIHDYVEGSSETFECEYRMRHKNGAYVWIHDRAKAVSWTADGTPLRILGTHTDITESRRLTEELFEEKERLRITLHSIGDAVICTDAGAHVTFMNPAAERMTGWSQAAAISQPLAKVFRIVDGASGEPLTSPVEQCLRDLRVLSLQNDVTLLSLTNDRYHIQNSAAPIRAPSGEIIGAILVFQDVTKARKLQKELTHAASHDPLTDLPNRVAFKQDLEEACKQVRERGRAHVVCFIDLDRFKIVNDTAGHAAGDVLLREIGRILRQQLRSHDVVARLGGDEFALLLRDCPMDQAERIAEKLIKSIGALRFQWDERVYEVGASVGATAITAQNALADRLMAEADIACYAAKNAGRNCVSVYNPEQSDAQQHHREILVAAGIRAALEANRFQLYAQEIRALHATKAPGLYLELMLRMLDEQGNLLVPGAFIPAAERYELMSHIDRWVISTAFQRINAAAISDQTPVIAINLSVDSLNDPFFLPFLQEQLRQSRLPPGRVHFEMTETAVINHLASAHQVIEAVRAAGCCVALDNFGTGLSSFGYLRQFPVDYVKIDGSFIRQLKHNHVDRAIVESIHELAHKLGAETIAEWVEDTDTLKVLRDIGIDYAQGYAIQRPALLSEILSASRIEDHKTHLTVVPSPSVES